MEPDESFLEYLKISSNNFSLLQATQKKYKNAPNCDCFTLNDALRKGENLSSNLERFRNELYGIIRAKNHESLTLYRMTSVSEFTLNGSPITLDDINTLFRYKAFLSTSRRVNTLHRFIPPSNTGAPTVLIIVCPPGTAMALMEWDPTDTTENEILLPAETEFKITSIESTTCKKCIEHYVGSHNAHKKPHINIMKLIVTNPPHELTSIPTNDFFLF